MAEIRPFQALRYHQERAGDIASLACPPYDIISPAQREELLARNPYNVVRLELPQGAASTVTPRSCARYASDS